MSEPDYDAEMRLPTGKRCDDCAHHRRCFGLGFSHRGRMSCDFWPSRYRPAPETPPASSAEPGAGDKSRDDLITQAQPSQTGESGEGKGEGR